MGVPKNLPTSLLWGIFFVQLVGSELVFDCPGIQEVAIIGSNYTQSFESICGDEAEISFNNSLSSGSISIYFSEDEEKNMDSKLLYTENMYIYPYHGDKIGAAVVYPDQIPCGTGYLVAVVSDMGMEVVTASARVAHICDNSDVRVKLVMTTADQYTTTESYSHSMYVNLKADGYTDVMDQLKYAGKEIMDARLENYGPQELPFVTADIPHTVLAYLRRRDAPMMPAKNCQVPDFTINDQIIGSFNYTDSLIAYNSYNLMYTLGGTIDKESKVCGDAVLVAMYDALHTDLDSDVCDNFHMMDVYVDCSSKMHHEEKCEFVPHMSIGGNELMMSHGDHSMFYHKVYEKSWESSYTSTMDKNRLFGLSRFILLDKILQGMKIEPHKGLCKNMEDKMMAKMMEGMTRMDIMAERPHMMTKDMMLESRVESLKNRITSMSSMNPDYALAGDIGALYAEGEMEPDPMKKAMKMAFSMGLNQSMSYMYAKSMYNSHGANMPSNITRLMLGGYMWHVGTAAAHASALNGLAKQITVGTVLWMSMGTLTLLDMIEQDLKPEVALKARYILNAITKQMQSDMSQNTTSQWKAPCAYEGKLSMISVAAMHLGNGYDGTWDSYIDDYDMCRNMMVFNYFRRGGARVHARDILDNLDLDRSYRKPDIKFPKYCKTHPELGNGMPYVMWKKDEKGRLMRGGYSPLTETVAWKTVATCRCDHCHGGYTAGNMYDWSTTHMNNMWYEQTTSPWWGKK